MYWRAVARTPENLTSRQNPVSQPITASAAISRNTPFPLPPSHGFMNPLVLPGFQVYPG